MLQMLSKAQSAKVIVFSGASEMVQLVREHYRNPQNVNSWSRGVFKSAGWIGRKVDSWEHLEQLMDSPWTEGLAAIARMKGQLADAQLEEPTSVSRRHQWNEEDGELSVDRFMDNNDSYYRRPVKSRRKAPKIISITCAIGGHCGETAEALFWRSAGMITACRLLEDAGYSCEINLYFRSLRTYTDYEYPNSFVSLPAKEAGQELDEQVLVNCMSTWFFRTVGISCLELSGTCTQGHGAPYPYPKEFFDMVGMGQGCVPLEFASGVRDLKSAVEGVKQILQRVEEGNSSD